MSEIQFKYVNPCLQWGNDNKTQQWSSIKQIEWRPKSPENRLFYIPNLWIPNSASSVTFDEMEYKSTPLTYYISNNGHVHADIPKMLHLDCPIRYRKFPFDRSICSIHLETILSVEQIQITGRPQEWVSDEMEMEMWIVRKLNSVTTNKTYLTTPPGTFSSITYYFEIERKGVLFVHTLILPSVMLLILQLGFIFLPSKGEGRAVYSMTVMLATSVLMTSVLSEIPRTSQHIAFIFNLSVQTIIGTLCTLYSLISICITKHPKFKQKWKFFGRKWTLMALFDCTFFTIVCIAAITVNVWTFFDMLT